MRLSYLRLFFLSLPLSSLLLARVTTTAPGSAPLSLPQFISLLSALLGARHLRVSMNAVLRPGLLDIPSVHPSLYFPRLASKKVVCALLDTGTLLANRACSQWSGALARPLSTPSRPPAK